MSNEDELKDDAEMEELKQEIQQKVKEGKATAADLALNVEKPSPDAEIPKLPDPVKDPEPVVTVTPSEAVEPPQEATATKDDAMEWAKKKGFKTPEDMARELLKKEQAYHQSKQQKGQEQQVQAPPAWNPQPQYPVYQPQYQPPVDIHRQIGQQYGMDPDDVRRVMPLIVDAAESIAARKTSSLEKRLQEIDRGNQRNNELMTLMQDPAFKDNRVQKEIHEILDSDPAIFQRERAPMVFAYNQALQNMARKQLQQVTEEPTLTNRPPVTAGGGNGSANTSPSPITDAQVASWTDAQQLAFFSSGGKVVPKK